MKEKKSKEKTKHEIKLPSKQEFFIREKKHYRGFKKGFRRKYKKK